MFSKYNYAGNPLISLILTLRLRNWSWSSQAICATSMPNRILRQLERRADSLCAPNLKVAVTYQIIRKYLLLNSSFLGLFLSWIFLTRLMDKTLGLVAPILGVNKLNGDFNESNIWEFITTENIFEFWFEFWFELCSKS